jgi:carbonic anhydrase
MLEYIRPAVDALSAYPGDQSSANPEFVHLVAEKNIRLTMENIRERSPVIREMEEQGQVRIVGASMT